MHSVNPYIKDQDQVVAFRTVCDTVASTLCIGDTVILPHNSSLVKQPSGSQSLFNCFNFLIVVESLYR